MMIIEFDSVFFVNSVCGYILLEAFHLTARATAQKPRTEKPEPYLGVTLYDF